MPDGPRPDLGTDSPSVTHPSARRGDEAGDGRCRDRAGACPGSVVALDAGTTSEEIARRWPYGHAATIVTTSPIVASALVGRSDVTVICVGGVLDPVWGACTGPAAVAALAGFHFDVAVVGVCGLDAATDAITSSLGEVEAKRAMVERAERVVVAATPEKLSVTAPYVICATRAIRHRGGLGRHRQGAARRHPARRALGRPWPAERAARLRDGVQHGPRDVRPTGIGRAKR